MVRCCVSETRWRIRAIKGGFGDWISTTRGTRLKKTPTERLTENILSCLGGPLAVLDYFGKAKISDAEYSHWGLERIYGTEETQQALKAAHTAALLTVLKTPIPTLTQEIFDTTAADRSHELSKMLRSKEAGSLIPVDPGAGLESHLKLVLYVL